MAARRKHPFGEGLAGEGGEKVGRKEKKNLKERFSVDGANISGLSKFEF